ncbi:MAG TPA: ParB/RepB/Spo0J family partition protein [Polyangiaceae bacterium]|nr:ParB/RepB/Spo0J family partition protein [Polyangiaceae bacterium]
METRIPQDVHLPAERTLLEVPVGRIRCRDQPRKCFHKAKLNELAGSVAAVGVAAPLTGYFDGDVVVLQTGERRFRAAQLAGLSTVPVVIGPAPDPVQMLHVQLSENLHRHDLTPIEKANAIGELIRQSGWSSSETASRLGMSPAQVSKLLSLLLLPDSVQQEVDAGKLAASTAYEIARIADPVERERLAQRALTQGLTRAGAADARRGIATPAKRARPVRPVSPRFLFRLPSGQSVAVVGVQATVKACLEAIGTLFSVLSSADSGGLALEDVVRQLSQKGPR